MRQVLAYRDRYQITDSVHPLGPHVGQGERADARGIADRALDTITARGTGTRPVARPIRPRPKPLGRAPAVLADARVSAEWMRREADGRARRGRAEQERDRATDGGW